VPPVGDPVAVIDAGWPEQMVAEVVVTVGNGLTLTVTVVDTGVQPLTEYPTVYVVKTVELTVKVGPVPTVTPPRVHVYTPFAILEVAVSVAGAPLQTVTGVTFNVGVGFTATATVETTLPQAGVPTVNV